MSYVPVYGSMSDNISKFTKSTSSRRGRVTRVYAKVNTHFGEAVNVEVSSQGEIKKIDEDYIQERIECFKQKDNVKKVNYWQGKLIQAKNLNSIAELNEKVYVEVELAGLNSATPYKFNYIFQESGKGYHVNGEDLKDVFANWSEIKKILPQLKITKALEEGNKKEEPYY